MSGSIILIHLAGAVALLLYATRMVRTGVERAYGDVLLRHLTSKMKNPLLAIAAGIILAVAFQSATAVSLLVGSFAGAGILGSTAGLVAVLGADLGSALVVKFLSVNLSILVPIALLCGTTFFLAAERRAWRQLGRILLGVGLLILSLGMIGEAAEPLREGRFLPIVINYLSGDPATSFLLAAVTTWLFHSSVAFILLVVALAGRGLVPVELGVVMVLGANFGGGVIAAMLSRTMSTASRTVPLGNLMIRGSGAFLVLCCLLWLEPSLDLLGMTASAQIVHAHIAFNTMLIIAGLPVAGLACRAAKAMLALAAPAAPAILESGETSALDPAGLTNPCLALANATREVVGICETVETMLSNVMPLFEAPDRARMDALAELDDRIDRRHAAVKLYLAKIATGEMSERDASRTQELLGACVKLEQAGDVIVRNLLKLARKKVDRGLSFTAEGWRELSGIHDSVLANARLAFNVLISRDREAALQLVREKERLRELERDSSQRHFDRLRLGTAKSVETSSLHLDTIRDLKQVNSLLASIAYPVLEEQGLLRESRLRVAVAKV